MKKMTSDSKSFIGISIIAALAASICCITPVLAIFGGISGMASSFSWLEPFRPFLIAITLIVLSFAIYRAYKPKKSDASCACEGENEKIKFMNSKSFLWIVTVTSLLMLSFPYYAQVVIPKYKKQIIPATQKSNISILKLQVKGMTCQACESHINHELSTLKGVINATTSYEEGTTEVKYDTTQTKKQDIIKAVNSTGYKVINIEKAIRK